VQPPDFVGAPKKSFFIDGSYEDLLPDGAVSVDFYDTRVFPKTDPGTTFEISNRTAHVGARTKGVRSFGGTFVFTTIARARLLSGANRTQTKALLVKTIPGISQEQVKKDINDNIFAARAWLGSDFQSSTVSFYLKHTSIATSVGTMVIFAFIAGFFIVGLTLYSSAIDRMKDYGTMKAIGATNGYIRKLIYTQAGLFAVTGFLIGQVLISGFKAAIEKQGLLIHFTPTFNVVFFFLICLIALGGGTFAARRITKMEPAEVFRF
jgi:putative ABC transport system permease protein